MFGCGQCGCALSELGSDMCPKFVEAVLVVLGESCAVFDSVAMLPHMETNEPELFDEAG